MNPADVPAPLFALGLAAVGLVLAALVLSKNPMAKTAGTAGYILLAVIILQSMVG